LSGRENIEITDDNLTDALHIIIEKMKMVYQTVKNSPLYENTIKK